MDDDEVTLRQTLAITGLLTLLEHVMLSSAHVLASDWTSFSRHRFVEQAKVSHVDRRGQRLVHLNRTRPATEHCVWLQDDDFWKLCSRVPSTPLPTLLPRFWTYWTVRCVSSCGAGFCTNFAFFFRLKSLNALLNRRFIQRCGWRAKRWIVDWIANTKTRAIFCTEEKNLFSLRL